MFSETSTGICCRPLCTAIVRPTMSGRIIERRDHVLIGRRSFFSAAVRTFFARCKSTNGPFLIERGTVYSSVELIASTHDHIGRALVLTSLLTLGVPTPRRDRMRITLTRLTFTTTVWMVNWIHHNTAHRWADAEPTLRAGFAVAAEVVFAITDFADGGAAIDMYFASFGGAQANGYVQTFASGQLHSSAGATC